MELASLIWFSSHPHPFAVQAAPCLDLACSCRDCWLTLTELNLQGGGLENPLRFQLRVDLQKFVERDPPDRSSEVHALAREFLVRFPAERIEELVEQWNEQREIQRRLATFLIEGPKEELLSYSEVIRAAGGLRESGRHYSFFFVHQGREFLIEDHYCANPTCDCQQVHVEFWERTEQLRPQHRVEVEQRLMATFSLAGSLAEIRFSQDGRRSTEQLLKSWQTECGYQLEVFRKRYGQMKEIGERSFARQTKRQRINSPLPSQGQASDADAPVRAGRNEPCPCGSGLKFKRCCARRAKQK